MLTSDDFVYFNSNVGLRELSNLKRAIIRGAIEPIMGAPEIVPDPEMHLYPSAEHYYVAHFAPLADKHLFYVDGALASWDDAVRICYPRARESVRANKVSYWRTRDMIGVFAKIYGNRANFAKCGDMNVLRVLWFRILNAKFGQNPDLRRVLVGTGSRILIEFDRKACRENADQIFWGARVIGGEIVGQNVMGEFMQLARDRFTRI